MADLHGQLSVRIRDFIGATITHLIYVKVADTTTLAQIVTEAQAYFVLLDPIIDGVGDGATFSFAFASTGLKTEHTVNNLVNLNGLFSFNQATIPYRFSVVVPTFAEGEIASGQIVLDTAPNAWISWMLSGSTHLLPESKDRYDLSSFRSCQLVARKHRKMDTRVSYEPAPEA